MVAEESKPDGHDSSWRGTSERKRKENLTLNWVLWLNEARSVSTNLLRCETVLLDALSRCLSVVSLRHSTARTPTAGLFDFDFGVNIAVEYMKITV
jgi:hypothetical protein